jgi:hypothetical protein
MSEYGEKLELKNASKATTQDKMEIYKYHYCQFLGIDKLTIDILKTFHLNKQLIYNFINIIDIKNYKHSNEAENKIKFEN